MKKCIQILFFLQTTLLISACGSSPFRHLVEDEVIESRYVTYIAPDTSWEVSKSRRSDYSSANIYAPLKGVLYHIEVVNLPFKEKANILYFDKNAEYVQILKDEDMKLTANDHEQGIGYARNWTSYVKGMKCIEGVFSRNGGGMMASITSKNYGVSCGYYHKTEGRRWFRIGYRYNYAAGPVRHQHDKNTPQEEFLTLEQAEMNLKLAVKRIVESLQIKDVDWERMAQEGLLHEGKEYTLSPF